MAADSRQRMIRTMGRLLQRQGFHATGLNQVVAESGAPKGSMYHHFPAGKEQLTVEAIRSSGEFAAVAMASTLASKPTAPEAIRAVVTGMAVGLERSGFEYGCPIATVALEASSDSIPVREACDEVFASWERLIAGRLVADGVASAEAAETATVVLAALEGGLILARTRQHTGPLLAVADSIDRLLG